MQTLRTPDELNNPDYNYYLAYVIDPSEKDIKKIETAMAQKKNHFGRDPIGYRLIQLYSEAIVIMADNILREQEFQHAKKFKLDTAEKTIVSIVRGRGTIYRSDLIKMADASARWITADEIEKKIVYLQQQGAKIIDDTKRSLDFLTYDKIEKKLKTALKTDLYDLLNISPSKSDNELRVAGQDIYSKYSPKMATDHKANAICELCGLVKTIFKDDNSKQYYDIYLATKDIWAEFALRRSTGISEMELREFLDYSERAKKALKTSDVDYIEILLAEGLSNFRIAVAGGEERGIDLESCPYCGMAYAANNNPKACPHCHNPLEIVCWNCGGKAPYTIKINTCPSCSATKNHSTRFDVIVKKIDNLLVQPGVSITDVQTELNNLKNILPDYTKSGSSKLTKKINEYQEKVNKKEKEEETIGKAYKEEYEKVQELVNLKKFFSASGAVTLLKNNYLSYNIAKTDTLIVAINKVITQVKLHADKAKAFSAQNNEEAAVSEIASALDLSVDYIEGKQIISNFPPKVPENVNAVIKDNAALISWVQSKQQKLVTYTVIQKKGTPPTSIDDGTVVINDLSITYFEDKTVISDTPYYYAVYSSRLGVNSSIVCSKTQVITYFDVSNIRQEIISGKIAVKWDPPLNVSEIEVIRKKGLIPPTGQTDGQKISVKNNESFEDSDFDKAGNSYRFICVYKSNKGSIYSKGVTRTFKAYEELKQLSNIKIEQNGTTSFTLKCDKVISGKRGIYYTTQEINCEFGKTVQIAEFKNFYKGLNETNLLASDENTGTFNLPPDKTYFTYPVIYNEQLLIVSKPILLNTMIGVSKINYSETSSEVIIKGQPHSYVKTIIAKISNTEFPINLSSDGDKITITKDEFVSNGLHIKLKTNSDSYITIFAETENEEIKSTTFGVSLGNVITLKEKATILYTIKYDISNRKSFSIKVDFKSDTSATVPELTLVCGNPRPLSINEGQFVDRTSKLTLKKGLLSGGGYIASTSIKSNPVATNTKFALFISTENKYITLKEVRSI